MSWGQRWASLWVLSVEQWELGQELACPDTLTPEQTRPEALLRGMKSETPARVGSAPRRRGRTVPGSGGRAQRPPPPPSRPVCLHAPFSTGPPLTAPRLSQPSERHSTSSRTAPPQALASRRVYADPRHLVAGGTRLTRGRPLLADCHSRVTPRA